MVEESTAAAEPVREIARSGDWVLVNAAGSGVGIAAIQIAKLFGARVVTTASTEAKRTRGIELGADAAVDYTQPGWPQEVERIADGRGVDIAADSTAPSRSGGTSSACVRTADATTPITANAARWTAE